VEHEEFNCVFVVDGVGHDQKFAILAFFSQGIGTMSQHLNFEESFHQDLKYALLRR
jgi:hypothetical protein